MTNYLASATSSASSTTTNNIVVTASASSTATSVVSQADAQNIANLIASQDANSEAQFSANILNQSIIVNNLQEYEPILQGYILTSEYYQNEDYIIKEDKYSLLTGYATLYDINTDKPIGQWGSYRQVSSTSKFKATYQQYYITIDDTLESYAYNRFQTSKYSPIGLTYMSQVIAYHNETLNENTNQYIQYILKTYRPSEEKVIYTILKPST
jgi:hypothetical protein